MEENDLQNPPEQTTQAIEPEIIQNDEPNNKVTTKYEPTECQLEYLKAAISIGTNRNKSEVARVADVRRENWYDWLKMPGFFEWFMVEFKRSMASLVYELDIIGLQKASEDFRYWESMQEKYGGKGIKGLVINNNNTAKAASVAEVEVGTVETQKRLIGNLTILQRHGFDLNGTVEEE